MLRGGFGKIKDVFVNFFDIFGREITFAPKFNSPQHFILINIVSLIVFARDAPMGYYYHLKVT